MIKNSIDILKDFEKGGIRNGRCILPYVKRELGSSIYEMLGRVTDVIELPGNRSYAIGVQAQDYNGYKYEKLFFIVHKYVQSGLMEELLESSYWLQCELYDASPYAEVTKEELERNLLGYTTGMTVKVEEGVPYIEHFFSDCNLEEMGYAVAASNPTEMEFEFEVKNQTELLQFV